jgi:hypothetical protein
LKRKSNLIKTLINKYFVVFLAFFCILWGCKDENVTENTNNNNNQNPDAPQLSAPPNNSTIDSLNPRLSWNSFQGAASYRVQLSMDANFAGIIEIDSVLSATQLTIHQGLLATNVNYYWRVIANLQSGNSNWSATWRFTVILAPPNAPNLIAPTNNSTNQSFIPLFDWDDPQFAEHFRIQVSENAGFTQILVDSSRITVSQLQCPPMILNTNTQYWWRVNASNSGGLSTSNWSTVFNFTTVAGPSPNTIKGTITFVESNFIPFPTYYMAGVFNSSQQWPPVVFPPPGFDSLLIKQIGNTYQAEYEIRNLQDGDYYVTVLAVDQIIQGPKYLGIYGCDTVHIPFSNCPLNPTRVSIVNGAGQENINFLSWADTAKVIF